MNKRTYELTVTSILIALVILLASIPLLGFIQLPFLPVPVTILHIPLLIAGAIGTRKMGAYVGLTFGLMSLIVAITRGGDISAALFSSPLVSVLPRLILGLILVDLLRFTKHITKFDNSKLSSLVLYFFIATIIHSILVLSLMYFTAYTGWYLDLFGTKEALTGWIQSENSIIKFIYGVLIANGLLEATFAVLIGVPIAKALLVKGIR